MKLRVIGEIIAAREYFVQDKDSSRLKVEVGNLVDIRRLTTTIARINSLFLIVPNGLDMRWGWTRCKH